MEQLNEFFHSEVFDTYLVPFLIFFARICDVTIGTFRIVMVSKGQKVIAPILGFFEVLIWIIVIGRIMQNIDNWVNIIAYACGFATGNYIGLRIEEKIAMGLVRINVITAKAADELIKKLKEAGYGITHHEANGATGKVSILYSIINRTDLPFVVEMISNYNPKAFYSIEDVKFVNKGVESVYTPKRKMFSGKRM